MTIACLNVSGLSCTGDSWQASANLTPAAGGAHLCYYHKASENLSLGVELEGSLRTQECATTIGYQLEIPNANLTFRGKLCKVDVCLEVYVTGLDIFFFGGSKLLLPGARPGSKTNFMVAKLYVLFYSMKIY